MKNTILTVLTAVAMTTALAFAQAEKKMPAQPMAGKNMVADTLMHHERMMLEALQKKDFTGFKKSIMTGSWSVDENGAATIDEFLKGLNDPKANFSFESFKTSDMKAVNIDANTALVTYKLEEKGAFMGQPFPPIVYATTIWANHGGTWMAVFH
jgi:hypothetical protein